jgi:hypothetical protein
LFLSTFVLSGLGTFLFVREVTLSPRVAFIAGLIYAFAPIRVPQFAHLQVISSQWMPFALYGLRRYFDSVSAVRLSAAVRTMPANSGETSPKLRRGGKPDAIYWGRAKALVGAGAALVAQNLSCGYFLMFFAPLVVAYVLFEIASRRLWTDVRMWAAIGVTAASVAVLTLPFLLPYLELRRLGFPARPLFEVKSFSADVFSYWTSPAESRLWGRAIRAFPKAEGDLFPTLTALVLGTIGLAATARAAWQHSRGPAAAKPGLVPLVYVLLAGCAMYAVFLVLILTNHGFASSGPLPISVRSVGPTCRILMITLAVLLAVSPRARSFAGNWLGSVAGFAVLATIAAFLLSLGPEITTEGRSISQTAPYAFFYWRVPGFDGLRVPARYGMLVMLFLSIVAGFGALAVERDFLGRRLVRRPVRRSASREGGSAAREGGNAKREGGRRTVVAVLLGLFAVAESIATPIVINGTEPEAELANPPSRVFTGAQVPPVYRFLQTLPARNTVVVEFPFGQWAYELRYVFYSTAHWHPLINGYSGTFPLSYTLRASVLRHPLENPEAAWESLVTSGATHAVVHENFYKDGTGKATGKWLIDRGARLVSEFNGDRVYEVKVKSGK